MQSENGSRLRMLIVVLDAELHCLRVGVSEIVLKLMRYLHNSFGTLNKKERSSPESR